MHHPSSPRVTDVTEEQPRKCALIPPCGQYVVTGPMPPSFSTATHPQLLAAALHSQLAHRRDNTAYPRPCSSSPILALRRSTSAPSTAFSSCSSSTETLSSPLGVAKPSSHPTSPSLASPLVSNQNTVPSLAPRRPHHPSGCPVLLLRLHHT